VITVKVLDYALIHEIFRAHTLLLEDENVPVSDLIECFTGFVGTPYHITWYASRTIDDPPMRAVMQAIKEGNQIVIVERLARKDPKCAGTRLDK
jgi:hypothetical protein